MIAVPAGVKVLVAAKPVDFRKGGDGLAALVREALGEDPFSGTIFIFRSKRADRLKIVTWDGTGLVLLWKRLGMGPSGHNLRVHMELFAFRGLSSHRSSRTRKRGPTGWETLMCGATKFD
jgi:transposase